MSHIVAIAGGSGALGRTLVDALKNSAYKPLILARQSNQALEGDIGVPVLQADYSNQDLLVQLFESHKIDTVVSCITNYDDSHNIELNIIAAAERASVTRRYIPSIWSGFDYTTGQGKASPFAASRIALLDALSMTKLEWTAIFPGIFLDFYTLSIPSYTKRSALAIDMDGNAAGLPGDGNYPVYFTHTTDLAKYTTAMLGLEHWEKKYFVYGDRMTWNEAVAVAEAAKGVKFSVAYDPIEKLERGEITELPGHKATYAHLLGSHSADAKAMFQKIMAGVAVFMAEGQMVYKGPLLNEIFPAIKPLKVTDAMIPNTAA
ncbi:NAD(P)-binding protein [Paraphaeosphaeria sporulosa]|uniref:NAD(P)-binding protein n=1 Tax=Paraphaeosphaeria sporulosa TaxID=1460663 RepID=A0A177C1Y8_9PLEO|nr:NAD(P)-binding protein [Paraphaeosphaeria sporulosa]OAG01466.1 NAD(P)-binding protein [Paraphaeosphaeria sporulosa]